MEIISPTDGQDTFILWDMCFTHEWQHASRLNHHQLLSQYTNIFISTTALLQWPTSYNIWAIPGEVYESTIFHNVMPCGVLHALQHFGETLCLQVQRILQKHLPLM
jgi:hypothetical protein